MVKRKQLSKKIRFEIFKRDDFTCQYCGQTPPMAILEVDHIRPVSKNGNNDKNNLITSCFDCNRGKSNVLLTKITPTIKENLDKLNEKHDQLIEYERLQKRIRTKQLKDCQKVSDLYSIKFTKYVLTDNFMGVSVKMFIEKIGLYEVMNSMTITNSKINDPDKAIKYFCGICWCKIKGKEINY